MATDTLRAMAMGGMRDHIGGGFHRYSVDAEWRVPHFEKMLYDQAQLALAYLEAAQATGDEFHASVAEDTLAYVMRDLTGPHGGFYSAEDADSVPPERAGEASAHKSEGAFYIWTDAEVGVVAGEDAPIARRRFGVEPDGNAPQDPQGEFRGRNILYIAQSIDDIATRASVEPAAVVAAVSRAREALFAARSRRPRPHLDDKVITAWNGLMIGAFARAARVLPGSAAASRYLAAATQAAEFIRRTLAKPDGTLLRRYRDGEAAIDGYAEDYASLVFGLLELVQADGNPSWLRWAIDLQTTQDRLFWDDDDASWFSTTGKDASVLLRLKEDYDGAEPAPASVSVLNLVTLESLTGNSAWLEKAERTLARLGPRIGAAGRVVPLMLAGLSAWHAERTQIVIVGPRDREDTVALHREAVRRYRPFQVDIQVKPGAHQESLSAMMPFVESMGMRDGRATAYFCRGFVCREPVTSVDALAALY
jgi:uncharacterized protein YyaL (SSP411 family)